MNNKALSVSTATTKDEVNRREGGTGTEVENGMTTTELESKRWIPDKVVARRTTTATVVASSPTIWDRNSIHRRRHGGVDVRPFELEKCKSNSVYQARDTCRDIVVESHSWSSGAREAQFGISTCHLLCADGVRRTYW